MPGKTVMVWHSAQYCSAPYGTVSSPHRILYWLLASQARLGCDGSVGSSARADDLALSRTILAAGTDRARRAAFRGRDS